MTVYDLTIAKISQLPESLVQEVNDVIDFLLLKYNSELPQLTELENTGWTIYKFLVCKLQLNFLKSARFLS